MHDDFRGRGGRVQIEHDRGKFKMGPSIHDVQFGQAGTVYDNGRDDHERGGDKIADCAQDKQDGCDSQGRSMSADKGSHATIGKSHQQCDEGRDSQSSFGKGIPLTGTPNGFSQKRGGQKTKEHCAAKKLTTRPGVKIGSGIGQNRWNNADGNQEDDSDQSSTSGKAGGLKL